MTLIQKYALIGMGIVVALCISVLLAEVWFRLDEGVFFFEKSRAVGGATDAETEKAEKIFRDSPDPGAHPDIVTLGGSTTFGLGLPAERTWPRLLAENLSQRIGRRVEIVNLGYLGGHLEQIEENLDHISTKRIPRYEWVRGERPAAEDLLPFGIKDLHPRLILMTPIVNDTIPEFFVGYDWSTRVCDDFRHSPLRRLALTHYACRLSLLRRSRASARDESRIRELLDAFDARLRSFVTHVRQTPGLEQTELTIVTLPWLFQPGDPEGAAEMAGRYFGQSGEQGMRDLEDQARFYPQLLAGEQHIIEHMAADLGLGYAGAHVLFRDLPFRQRLRLFSDSIHTNEDGSIAVANFISAYLAERLTWIHIPSS